MDSSDFLNNFILPLHIGKRDKNILFEIQDLKQNILLCSHKNANLYGLESANNLEGMHTHQRLAECSTND